MRRHAPACNRSGRPGASSPPPASAPGLAPQVLGAAETSVVEVVVVAFLGSVLVGTEVVVDACEVVVVVSFDVFPPLTAGTVVEVVVVVVAPGVVAPITCCAWAMDACIALMSVWNCDRFCAFSAASALV